ncbi:hypothetical protein HYS11_00235 [Candidatus Gottesmanbacteria bacterium]|nr:hypothetical protein [Candidatus Gottesmanbacteria bacterium]
MRASALVNLFTTLVALIFVSSIIASLVGAVELNWGLSYPAPWVQVKGGNTYAWQGFGQIIIPTAATPRYFILDQVAGHPGIAVCQSGGCELQTNYGSGQVSSQGWKVTAQPRAVGAYDFDLYNRRLKPATCPSASSIPSSDIVRAGVHCYTPSGSSINITAGANVVVPGTVSSIVLVNGNLKIDKPIRVISGGFVAFIASGDITIDPSIGTNPPDNLPDVDGIYIATKKFSVETSGDPMSERQFVGRGTFIGYQGVSLRRDLGRFNSTYPAELFIYETDFNRNADPLLLRSQILWQQVAP